MVRTPESLGAASTSEADTKWLETSVQESLDGNVGNIPVCALHFDTPLGV